MALILFIDDLTFDPASGEVRRGAQVRRLEPQPAALLALLSARAGTLVSHAEIASHLWAGGTHVDFQGGVHYAVRQIRGALGDAAGAPRFVETIPRRGYRFRSDALRRPADPDTTPARERRATGGDRSRRSGRIVAAMMAAAVLLTGLAVVERLPNDHHARVVALLTALHDVVY